MIVWHNSPEKGLYVIVDGDVWKATKHPSTLYIKRIEDIERTPENTLKITWGL